MLVTVNTSYVEKVRKMSRFFPASLLRLPSRLFRRSLAGCFRRLVGCTALFLLATALLTLLLWLTIKAVGAQTPAPPAPLAVHLLIDNSHSMFDKGGLGSDPELLRIDAARLFISYLGVDDSQVIHRCGVIFFGSEAELVVPLTALTGPQRRAEMFERIARPNPLGWTDQVAALSLARADLDTVSGEQRPAIVLLTDGKPEWNSTPTREEQEAYLQKMQAGSRALAEAGIPLFIILLANEATDADPAITTIWQPQWEAMSAATAPGRFYIAREAEDLPDIYHDIVVALTGNRTSGAVIQSEVGAGGIRRTVAVEADLSRLTLVVAKSQPQLSVRVLLPDGQPLTPDIPGTRYIGEPGVSREEIWVIEEPVPGDWTVLVDGTGRVTVWKDYRRTVAPVVTPSATPTTVPTPSPTPTALPARSPVVQGLPEAALVGQTVTLTVALEQSISAGAPAVLQLTPPGQEPVRMLLLDDGRDGDAQAGDGLYTARFQPQVIGMHTLTLHLEPAYAPWQARLLVEPGPDLVLAPLPEQVRAGRELRLEARWQLDGAPLPPAVFVPAASGEAYLQQNGETLRTVPMALAADGTLVATVPLQATGILTVHVSATGVTAGGQQISATTPAHVLIVRTAYPYWAWGAGGVAAALTGSAFWYRRRRQQRPVVEGTLRRIDGAPLVGDAVAVELDELGRSCLVVGAAPADLVLPGAGASFRLEPGPTLGDSRQMLIIGPPEVLHNHRPLQGKPQALHDADTITLGSTHLRYENLRLRSAERALL